MTKVLFICSQNRLRSPTAERVFSARAGFEVLSAGLSPEAETPVCPDLLAWCEVIFVMEKAHRNKLAKKFRTHIKDKRIICLDIPDEFEFMDPALIRAAGGQGRCIFSWRLTNDPDKAWMAITPLVTPMKIGA